MSSTMLSTFNLLRISEFLSSKTTKHRHLLEWHFSLYLSTNYEHIWKNKRRLSAFLIWALYECWVDSIRPRRLYPKKKIVRHQLKGRLGGRES
jgi:hypothetical protein